MKKYLLAGLLLYCGVLIQSCEKPALESKNVTINESINPGDTYTLDLGKYADRDAKASITTQAVHYTMSKIDRDPVTARHTYYFSIDSKQQEKESVVIEITKDGRCNHDSKTVVHVNLTVLQ